MSEASVTNMADVIEESLEIELRPKNVERLQKLTSQHFHKLAIDLYEHAKSEYLMLPRTESAQLRFVAHPNGQLSRDLGGAGEGTGNLVERPADELFGTTLTSLLYLPSIAVADGLQYSLDLFFNNADADAPRFRASVLRSLEFYSLARDLIAQESLVLIPCTLWLDPLRAPRESGHFFVEDTDPRLPLAIAGLASDRNDYFPSEARNSARFVDLSAKQSLKTLDELLSLCAALDYLPLIDFPEHSIILSEFEAQQWHDASARRRQDRGSLLPWLSRIPAADFLVLRNSDAFEEFRGTVEALGRDIRGANWGDADRVDHVEQTIERARKNLEQSLASSDPLARFFTSVKRAFIGGLAGLALTQNPLGAGAGATTAIVKDALAIDAERDDRKRQQTLLRAYASMLSPALS